MSKEQLAAFLEFKIKYHAFVQTDTDLGNMDYDDQRIVSVERKAKLFKAEADEAERAFRALFP